MNEQTTLLALAVSYAVIGALLLIVLVFARFSWRLKAGLIVVVSAFYVFDFVAARSLLGWASPERLPHYFKLLQARVVEPHDRDGDPGTIYLWVEALGEDNRPVEAPRAFRLPFTTALATKTERAIADLRDGRPQGGLTDDRGLGQGGAADPVRPHMQGQVSLETTGGDPSGSGELMPLASATGEGLSFTPLLPPRMPPKDRPALQ